MTKRRTLADVKRQQKYEQEHPGIFIRMSREQYDIIKVEAKARRWSMASLVAYVLENHFDLPESDIDRRQA